MVLANSRGDIVAAASIAAQYSLLRAMKARELGDRVVLLLSIMVGVLFVKIVASDVVADSGGHIGVHFVTVADCRAEECT